MQPELLVDAEIYQGNFPNFKRPSIIGYIGLENLKYGCEIYGRKVNFDLNLHIEKAIRKPDGLDVKLTDLLQFLLQNEIRLNFAIQNSLDNSKFFCYRGLMTCIALTPFENKEPWKIVAWLYKGNIYLCARDTDEKQKRLRDMTPDEKKFTSWGYKFEQYILSDTPNSEPNPDVPVDETEEFSLVFTTKLNRHSIVYGAEMDGIKCNTHTMLPPPTESGTEAVIQYLSNKEFIELKTNRHLEHPRHHTTFKRFKTKKWWCQSFLVGINKILCGFRNDLGIVEQLKVYHVKDLPRMSKNFWNPNVCFNFLDAFFTHVKRCLAQEIIRKHGDRAIHHLKNLPLTCLLFEWNPGSPVQLADHYSAEDDPILPDWFLSNYGKESK